METSHPSTVVVILAKQHRSGWGGAPGFAHPLPTIPQGAHEAAILATAPAHIGDGNPIAGALAEPLGSPRESRVSDTTPNVVGDKAAASNVPFSTVSTIPLQAAASDEAPASAAGPVGTLRDPQPDSVSQLSSLAATTGSIPMETLPRDPQAPQLNGTGAVPAAVVWDAATNASRASPGHVPDSDPIPDSFTSGIPIDQLAGVSYTISGGPPSSAVPANFCQGKFGTYADPTDPRCWVTCFGTQSTSCCPNNYCFNTVLGLSYCNIFQARTPIGML